MASLPAVLAAAAHAHLLSFFIADNCSLSPHKRAADAPHQRPFFFLPARKQMKKSVARFIKSLGRRGAREGGSSPGCRPSRRGQCRDQYRKLRGSAPQSVRACCGFFFGVSVTLACVAGTLQPADDSCYFEGRRYSPGALAMMGRLEMACAVQDGAARWAHAAY